MTLTRTEAETQATPAAARRRSPLGAPGWATTGGSSTAYDRTRAAAA
jgi:hypothetical protein